MVEDEEGANLPLFGSDVPRNEMYYGLQNQCLLPNCDTLYTYYVSAVTSYIRTIFQVQHDIAVMQWLEI